MDDLERIIRPTVEGQVRDFAKSHPSVVEAVDWYKSRTNKTETLVNSISKRIVLDLLSNHTRQRLQVVFSGPGTAEDEVSDGMRNCRSVG